MSSPSRLWGHNDISVFFVHFVRPGLNHTGLGFATYELIEEAASCNASGYDTLWEIKYQMREAVNRNFIDFGPILIHSLAVLKQC